MKIEGKQTRRQKTIIVDAVLEGMGMMNSRYLLLHALQSTHRYSFYVLRHVWCWIMLLHLHIVLYCVKESNNVPGKYEGFKPKKRENKGENKERGNQKKSKETIIQRLQRNRQNLTFKYSLNAPRSKSSNFVRSA